MKKSEVKKMCAELFNKYMGIKIPSTAVTLMELTAGENTINYVYFTVGNRHYVYNDTFYRSFVMFPDDTLTDGIQLEMSMK